MHHCTPASFVSFLLLVLSFIHEEMPPTDPPDWHLKIKNPFSFSSCFQSTKMLRDSQNKDRISVVYLTTRCFDCIGLNICPKTSWHAFWLKTWGEFMLPFPSLDPSSRIVTIRKIGCKCQSEFSFWKYRGRTLREIGDVGSKELALVAMILEYFLVASE